MCSLVFRSMKHKEERAVGEAVWVSREPIPQDLVKAHGLDQTEHKLQCFKQRRDVTKLEFYKEYLDGGLKAERPRGQLGCLDQVETGRKWGTRPEVLMQLKSMYGGYT